MQLSIAQILAQRAAISRRAAAKMISAGQVEVDGAPCTSISTKIAAGARIKLAGKLLPPAPANIQRQVLLYYKPVGELCGQIYNNGRMAAEQSEQEQVTPEQETVRRRRSVFDSLPPLADGKWIMVGRLDINTSGLLLFTNDGELAYRLMHPKYKLDREYIARVKGRSKVTERTLQQLKRGIYLQDKPAVGASSAIKDSKHSGGSRGGKPTRVLASFSDIVPMHKQSNSNNQYFYLVVQEGRNRLVRRVWESAGYQVSRLIRVRFATVNLPPDMKPGKSVLLKKQEVQNLANCVGL